MRFFALFILLVSESLLAQNLNPLYEVIIENPDKHSNLTNLKMGLQTVINRLTPGANDLENPVLQTVNPHKLPHTLRYRTVNHSRILYIQFEPIPIHQLMVEAGLEPWIKTRPTIQTWVIILKGFTQSFGNSRDYPHLFHDLNTAAQQKGLHLEFASDEFKILTNPYLPISDKVPRSTRYARLPQKIKPEAVLVIEFNLNDDRIHCESWDIYFKERNQFGRNCPESRVFGQETIKDVGRYLFSREKRRKKKPYPIYVAIHNIKKVTDYEAADDYLQHIPGVINTNINSVTADTVLYKLDIKINSELLVRRLNNKYEPLPAIPEENIINYRFKT